MRNGSVCRTPPKNVPRPVIAPRDKGLPRPVRSPLSDSPSEKAMLTPAPIAVASPARKASCGWCVAKATAKIGASVDREPSLVALLARKCQHVAAPRAGVNVRWLRCCWPGMGCRRAAAHPARSLTEGGRGGRAHGFLPEGRAAARRGRRRPGGTERAGAEQRAADD